MITLPKLEAPASRIPRLVARALLTVAASAATLALPVSPALAGGSTVSLPSVTVSYVTSMVDEAGYAAELYARLREAAEQVCGEADIRLNRRQRDVAACIERSVDRAVGDVASPVLLAVHRKAPEAPVRLAGAERSEAR